MPAINRLLGRAAIPFAQPGSPRELGIVETPQPQLGIPPEMQSGASSQAQEGSRAEKIEARGRVIPGGFRGLPFATGGAGAMGGNLIPSIGRGFGIPSGAYDPNVPGGIGRPFAIAPGLVFDSSTPGGVRKEATTLDAILEKSGLTDTNISEIMRIGSGQAAPGLPGDTRGGAVSPRLGGATASQQAQANLFADPAFAAAFNASREASDARFQTARSRLASLAEQTGGRGSGEFMSAMGRLDAFEAKQRSQDILDAAARVPIQGGATGGGSLLDAVNTDSDVQRIQQTMGATLGGLARQVLDAKKKGKMFSEDMASVRGSAPTFLQAGQRSAQAIRRGHEALRAEQEAMAINEALLEDSGIDPREIRRAKTSFQLFDKLLARERLSQQRKIAGEAEQGRMQRAEITQAGQNIRQEKRIGAQKEGREFLEAGRQKRADESARLEREKFSVYKADVESKTEAGKAAAERDAERLGISKQQLGLAKDRFQEGLRVTKLAAGERQDAIALAEKWRKANALRMDDAARFRRDALEQAEGRHETAARISLSKAKTSLISDIGSIEEAAASIASDTYDALPEEQREAQSKEAWIEDKLSGFLQIVDPENRKGQLEAELKELKSIIP